MCKPKRGHDAHCERRLGSEIEVQSIQPFIEYLYLVTCINHLGRAWKICKLGFDKVTNNKNEKEPSNNVTRKV